MGFNWLSCRISPITNERLKAYLKKSGIIKQHLIDDAINEYLNRLESDSRRLIRDFEEEIKK